MTLDLDVATPEETARILRAAAEKYRESVGELSAAWQDPHAGRIWRDYARILERAADACDRAYAKRLG